MAVGTWYLRVATGVSQSGFNHVGQTYENSGANGTLTYTIQADPSIYLDGTHAESNAAGSTDIATADASLPVGFIVSPFYFSNVYHLTGTKGTALTGSETIRVQCPALGVDFTFNSSGGISGGSFGTFLPDPASMGGNWASGVPFGGAIRMTGMTLAALKNASGFTITVTIANIVGLGTVVLPDDGPAIAYGTYTTFASAWYYNSGTNHFQYASSNPGAGWALASPTPGDPTPAIASVKRYTVYNNGVADVTSLTTPAKGCAGTLIFIAGTGFGDGATVTVGGLAATSVTVLNANLISCVVPAHVDATVDVVVTNADGTANTIVSGYIYVTPWWVECVTQLVDGVPTLYAYFFKSCSAPATGVWTQTTDPALGTTGCCGVDTNPDGQGYASSAGWYASTAAYAGNVLVLGTNDRPAPPRTWDQLAWAVSDGIMLGGTPACVFENRLIYPSSAYTQGTEPPVIRVFDGLFDRKLCALPPTPTDTVPKALLSMLAANGTIYLTTHDSGTSSADWRGRVFQLDLASGQLIPIGSQFAAGELPYALCWHMGRLWCSTTNTIGTAGAVYYFRPGIDTAWTSDYSLATSSVGGGHALISFKGKLYVGTDNASGSRGKVLVRDTAGAYTTSDTGSGGAAHINNGYLSFAEFNGNLYAGYWNNDATAVSLIRKFDGTTWTTAYTGATTTLRPFNVLLSDNGVLYAFGCAQGLTGAIVTTPDGTTWTNRTGNLTETTARELNPACGVLIT